MTQRRKGLLGVKENGNTIKGTEKPILNITKWINHDSYLKDGNGVPEVRRNNL